MASNNLPQLEVSGQLKPPTSIEIIVAIELGSRSAREGGSLPAIALAPKVWYKAEMAIRHGSVAAASPPGR